MKNLFKLLSLFFVGAIILTACKKDENRVYFLGGHDPVLTASSDEAALSFSAPDQEALKLTWTNPDYKFTTGVSSQDVLYVVEIDEAGAGFAGANKKSISVTKDLAISFTSAQLNLILALDMGLSVGEEHELEARVSSNLVNGNSLLASNSVSFFATPYSVIPPPKVAPPAAGTLWMLGDASNAGWDNPMKTPYDVDQQFTKIDDNHYELTVNMPGGGGYKLIQTQGVWGTQYHMTTGTWDLGEFEKKDSDPQFPGPPVAGQYKITIDFQEGKYYAVKL